MSGSSAEQSSCTRSGWRTAIAAARDLAHREGIFCGISAGATFAGARAVAEKAPKGSVLLAMLPDTGERYFSTPLFEGVNEGSDDEWLAGVRREFKGTVILGRDLMEL